MFQMLLLLFTIYFLIGTCFLALLLHIADTGELQEKIEREGLHTFDVEEKLSSRIVQLQLILAWPFLLLASIRKL